MLFEKLEENRKFVESALALVDNHAFRINYILIVVKDDDATGFGTGGGVLGVEFRTINVDVPTEDGSEVEGGLVAEVPADSVHEISHLHIRNTVGRTEAGGMSSEFFQNLVVPYKLAGEDAGGKTGGGNGFRHMIGHLMTFL